MSATKRKLTPDNPIHSYPGFLKSAYGSLRNLRVPKIYWNTDKSFTFKRRVGKYAAILGLTDQEFKQRCLDIGLKDKRMAPFELKFSESFGPFNFHDPDGLLNNLDNYYQDWDGISAKWSKNDLKALQFAFNEVLVELQSVVTPSDRPLTLEESVAALPPGTNSGLPFYTSSEWTEEMLQTHLGLARRVLDGDSKCLPPFVLQQRIQPKGWVNTKLRPVWNPSKAELVAAGTLTRPVQSLMQRLECYQGYNGPHTLPSVFSQWFQNYSLFISLDFSSYDATIHPYLMNLMMGVVNKLFPGNGKLLTALLEYYTTGDILVPSKGKKGVDIWSGSHGVPSGIGATFMTSLINRAMIKVVMAEMGIDNYAHIANGDDTALAISEDQESLFDLDKLSSIYQRYGLIVNPDPRKQEVSRKGIGNEMCDEAYLTFLGRYYFESDCSGKMPVMRMATGIFYQERYTPEEEVIAKAGIPEGFSPSDIILAADCIAIIQKLENCAHHDNHSEFVNFISSHTPFGLDVNVWATPNMDLIARAVRSGRISRTISIMDYKTIKCLLTLQNGIVEVTGKSLLELWKDSLSDQPQYKNSTDTRHLPPMEVTVEADDITNLNDEVKALLGKLLDKHTHHNTRSVDKSMAQAEKRLKLRQLELKDLESSKTEDPSERRAIQLRKAQLNSAIAQISANIEALREENAD